MKNALAFGLLLSISASVASAASSSKLVIDSGGALTPAIAAEVGTKIAEVCSELSASDRLQVTSVAGAPGYADFNLEATRTSESSTASETVSVKAIQNVDVPFDREYTISCSKRPVALADQSSIDSGVVMFSKGIDLSAKFVSVEIQPLIETSVQAAPTIATKPLVVVTKANGLVVNYTRGSDTFVHHYGIPASKMSAAFKAVALDPAKLQAPATLVNPVVKRVATKRSDRVCTKHVAVQVPKQSPDDDGYTSVCVASKAVVTRGELQSFELKAKF